VVNVTRGFRKELLADTWDEHTESKCSSPPSLKRQSMRLLGKGVSKFVTLEDAQLEMKRQRLLDRAAVVADMVAEKQALYG
jgi:hypothetical protein